MLRIDDLQLFVRTADSGSLSAAARGLDVSPAVASAALKRLEASLSVRLFVRSTRSLRLTAEGEAYLLHARAALASLHEGAQALAGGREAISGVLQLSAPSDFGRNVLLPWLDEFQASHPQLQVRLLLGDGLTDLFRQPVDIVLRYGAPEDSSLVALPGTDGCCALRLPTCNGTASHDGWTSWRRTTACASCSPGACMTAGAFRKGDGRSPCRSAVTGSVTMPTWCVAGRWPAAGWPTSPGWTLPTTWPRAVYRCCCRTVLVRRRHSACSAPIARS